MQRKWYQKKRYWFLAIVLLVFFISRLESLKMRYHPDELAKSLIPHSPSPLLFKKKKIDGSTIHYCQLGDDSNLPVVLLVHGSPGSLAAYEDYLKDTLLNQRANLIAVDRLGFGYSDFGITVPFLSLQAKLIATILEDFPYTPKIIVGHSMGGPVNSRLALDYPHLVSGMILIAPSIAPNLEPPNWWRKMLDFPFFRWFMPTALRVCNQEIIPLKKELIAMENRWKDITCPVSIIQGSADYLVPAGNAYFAEEKLVNSSKVQIKMIEGGNHFILWSEIPLIRKTILEMLSETNL